MVHRLDSGLVQVTALNFSNHPISDRVVSEHLPPGAAVIDMLSEQKLGTVDQGRTFPISLSPHQGMSLLIADMPEGDRLATAVASERITVVVDCDSPMGWAGLSRRRGIAAESAGRQLPPEPAFPSRGRHPRHGGRW